MQVIKNLNNILDESDFWDAVAQVVISVALMFLPFLLLAWNSLESDSYEPNVHFSKFIAYFLAGELGIPIFAVFGATLFLMFRKVGPIGTGLSVFLAIIVTVIILWVALIIGSNPGFMEPLPDQKLTIILVCYLVTHLIWIYVIWKSQGTPPSAIPEPETEKKKAIELIKKARGE